MITEAPTFIDLIFAPHPRTIGGGFQAIHQFDNGLILSVVCGTGTGSVKRTAGPEQSHEDYESYELAVMDRYGNFITGKFCKDSDEGSICSYLNPDEISDIMYRVYLNDTLR
jgi:hypothetical protein